MRWFLRGGVRVLTRIQHLLSILKHKNNEKACEKCEFVITDGPSQTTSLEDEDEERDTLESRLTVRLHCKHGKCDLAYPLSTQSFHHRPLTIVLNVFPWAGVVKTHRLSLNPANNLNSPTMADPARESRLIVGPRVIKSLLEHFPFGKGAKSDPQLIWNFGEDEVQLRSLESSVDSKGGPLWHYRLTGSHAAEQAVHSSPRS